MIGSSHSQLCKKNSCSLKVQDGDLLLTIALEKRLWRILLLINLWTFLFIIFFWNQLLFCEKINDIVYVLLNNFLTDQLSMPASEFTNKCDTRYFLVFQSK